MPNEVQPALAEWEYWVECFGNLVLREKRLTMVGRINELANEGWEPHRMSGDASSTVVLFRRMLPSLGS